MISSQPCLPETIDCSVSSCINIKMTSNIINVDTSFRNLNYSIAFVSVRFPRFHIPKFHQISVTCLCVLPSDHVNMFLFVTTFHNHLIYKGKGVAAIPFSSSNVNCFWSIKTLPRSSKRCDYVTFRVLKYFLSTFPL